MPARHALKVIDDRPVQIFVAKPGENPAGWAVPVQRMLTILKPLQALEFSRRCVIAARSTLPRTPRRTAASVALDCNRIKLSILPRYNRASNDAAGSRSVNRFFSTAHLTHS